jgi:hypothetical protein
MPAKPAAKEERLNASATEDPGRVGGRKQIISSKYNTFLHLTNLQENMIFPLK